MHMQGLLAWDALALSFCQAICFVIWARASKWL